MRGKRRVARGPTPIADLVSGIVRRARPTSPARQRLAKAFAAAAGANIAAQVRVRGRRGPRLLLETASAALLHELQGFRAGAILERWPADPPAVPAITELHVRLGGSTDPDA